MNIKKIGIIATSSPGSSLSKTALERGIDFFTNKNIELVFAQNVLSSQGYVAGTANERLETILNFSNDSSIDLIMNFWGGSQTHHLLDDSHKLFPSSKPIIGYSDTTPLLNHLANRGSSRCFLGPAFISFCKPEFINYSWEYFIKALNGESFEVTPSNQISTNRWYEDNQMKVLPSSGWKCLRQGKVEGHALGGNMGSLLLTAGTRYWPDLQGCVLFLEEDESESIETIDRFLTQFRQIGAFEKCAAVVLGRFMDGVFRNACQQTRLYEEIFRDFKGPVIYDADFGHADPIFTIPLGRNAIIETSESESRIQFKASQNYLP